MRCCVASVGLAARGATGAWGRGLPRGPLSWGLPLVSSSWRRLGRSAAAAMGVALTWRWGGWCAAGSG